MPSDASSSDGVPIDAPAIDASPVNDPAERLSLTAITPAIGTVKGGTVVTLAGTGFVEGAAITIGGLPCALVTVFAKTLVTCISADSNFVEGAMDVVITNGDGASATLSAAYTYLCPWTTSKGRRSCGAVPPRPAFREQVVTSWVTQFQVGHGFVANTVAGTNDNLDDSSDSVLGSQSAVIETDGAGTARLLTRTNLAPIDFTGRVPKIWVKLTNVTSAVNLQLLLGDSNLANRFRFRFDSTQGQRWTTDDDWVAFTMSWSPANVSVVGTPNRAAITDVQLRVVDNASGNRVRFRINGIGLVDEPAVSYPNGGVSITFDDNFSSMVSAGLPVLAAEGFPATAYVITDMVGESGRSTLGELQTLQDVHGWEIAVHSATDVHHAARFPNLSAEELEDDLVDARAWLIANGFRGFDHCAYPGGDFTGGIGTNVLGLVRKYFATCRTIYQGEREMYLPADSHKLRVFYVTNGVPLASAIAAVDNARAHREWIILVFHKLVAAPASSTEWSSSDFAALVAHIAMSGMPVKTVGEVLAQ